MNKPIIVLVTQGKHESVDYVAVKIFDTVSEANDYVDKTTDKGQEKYWSKAEIVSDGERVELYRPEF